MKIFPRLFLGFLIFLVVIIQVSFVSQLGGSFIFPNLLYSLVFSLFLIQKRQAALLAAFLGGILYDVLALNLAGITSLILLSFLYLTYLLRKHFSLSLLFFFLLFLLGALSYRFFLRGFQWENRFLFSAFGDLILLIFFKIILRRLLSLMNPDSSLQLKFRGFR